MNGLMHCSKIASLFDHLVSAEQGHRHVRADRSHFRFGWAAPGL